MNMVNDLSTSEIWNQRNHAVVDGEIDYGGEESSRMITENSQHPERFQIKFGIPDT